MSNPLNMAFSIGDWLLRRRMKHMIVHVTNKCNLRCKHCFVEFESSKKDMELSLYKKIAADSPPLMWLDIGGGEPFLREDLAEIILSFKSRIVHIPTNASLIPQIYKQLNLIRKKSNREIIIGLSLDGFKETHNAIRGSSDSWDNVWAAYEVLSDLKKNISGLSVKICTSINNYNYNEIIPLMEEVRGRNVDFHSVFLLRGKSSSPDIGLPDISKIKSLGPEIFKILDGYNYGKTKFAAGILRNFNRYLWNVSVKTLEI